MEGPACPRSDYLTGVKTCFKNNPKSLDKFYDILDDFTKKGTYINSIDREAQIGKLVNETHDLLAATFPDHPDIASGFTKWLQPSEETDELKKRYGSDFVERVKERFKDQPERYAAFIEPVLVATRSMFEGIPKSEAKDEKHALAIAWEGVYEKVRIVLEGEKDLMKDFEVYWDGCMEKIGLPGFK